MFKNHRSPSGVRLCVRTHLRNGAKRVLRISKRNGIYRASTIIFYPSAYFKYMDSLVGC